MSKQVVVNVCAKTVPTGGVIGRRFTSSTNPE
jgi:hypothetical protein